MALDASTVETMRSIALTSARREDGLPAYPPFPYAILRKATVAMLRVLAMGGMAPRLIQTLNEYESTGHFIHPRTANFLLVLIEVYNAAQNTPHLSRATASHESDDDGSDDHESDESHDDSSDEGDGHVKLAYELGERYAVSARYFLNDAD